MSTLRVNNIQFNQEGNAAISVANSYNVAISVDGSEKFRIAKDGINFSGPISVNNNIIFNGTGGFVPSSPVAIDVNSSNAAFRITQTGSGNALVVEDSSNPDSTPFVVDAGGNVGIGTSTPASKLDVNGGAAGNIVAVAASAVDCSLGNFFTKTASGALSWTATNVPASRAFSFTLELTNGGTGAQTWFANTKWAGGTAPTLTTSGVDYLAFVTDDGGSTWVGLVLGLDVK